jgi:hypothetical protein
MHPDGIQQSVVSKKYQDDNPSDGTKADLPDPQVWTVDKGE